jgi:TatD DNase family protein
VIDTHCHLTDPRLGDQLEAVLARATSNGVDRVITIATDPEDCRAVVALCQTRPNVRCVIGIHPNYTGEITDDAAALGTIRERHADPTVVALGEMGLDYFRDTAPRDRQRTFFESQLALAVEFKKPVVIHSREAIADSLAVMANFPGVRAIFHSFTGTPAELRAIVDRGYLVGFTGPVTYKKNDALREAARDCPIDQLVVETDAPYLSPEPMRSQKINEPALVVYVARRIAELKQMSYDAFDAATTRNAERFFGL